MKYLLRILFLPLAIFLANPVQAQTSTMSSFRKNFATVMFCGLGGAVLGLSTLSFYGKPDEHIGNISTGFALGVLGGVAFAAADTAQAIRRVESYSLHDNRQGKRLIKSDAITLPIVLADF